MIMPTPDLVASNQRMVTISSSSPISTLLARALTILVVVHFIMSTQQPQEGRILLSVNAFTTTTTIISSRFNGQINHRQQYRQPIWSPLQVLSPSQQQRQQQQEPPTTSSSSKRSLASCLKLFSMIQPTDQEKVGLDNDDEQQKVRLDGENDDDDYDVPDPDAPAGIGGAEFFGGNKRKEEFYDPIAERDAAKDVTVAETSYNRFAVTTATTSSSAFTSDQVSVMAQSIQKQINDVLGTTSRTTGSSTTNTDVPYTVRYSPQVKWESPLINPQDGAKNPFEGLQMAKKFYRQIDVAIVAGKQISDGVVEFSWEVSVVWPTFWAPRVLLVGTSTCTIDNDVSIVKQVDRVFGCTDNNLLALLGSQIVPRFWDSYYIGMTPSAELLPRQVVKRSGSYTVYKLPSRMVTAPTIIETGTRDERNAETVPNHAFPCIIKTMGPQKENYVPTTPIEVRIGRPGRRSNNDEQSSGEEKDNRLVLSWLIPLSVQFQAANTDLPLPGDDPEVNDQDGSDPTFDYVRQPSRQVATVSYGGNVQDEVISDIRKRLYEQVLKDGLKPKLDEDGRPQFFFWQNDVKACYTENGLGMCVYVWRPAFFKSNEVGIELDM